MAFRPWAGSLIALALATSVRIARAEEAAPSIRLAARELATEGADAFDRQDYATALDRFQRADALYKAPSIEVMVARCLSRRGRIVEAVDKYEETLRMPLDAAAPDAFRRAVSEAAAEVEPTRARLAHLELLLPSSAPKTVTVLLDGKPMPTALIGVSTPVDPGVHRVAARADGFQPYARELVLAEGSKQPVEIALVPGETADAAETRASAPESHAPSTPTLALLSAAGAGVVFGSITGVLALGHRSKLERECKPGCPASMSSELDAYRTTRSLSYVGFGIGLAAAGAGAYFWFRDSRGGTRVGALLGPTGGALVGSF